MITAADIRDTYGTISGHLRRTPIVEVGRAGLGLPATCEVVLKLEQLQYSGSFKVRGAFANLLLRTVPTSGVVAASGGNHGAAVAYAAQQLGLPATIFVPTVSSPVKVDRIRALGAHLVVGGDRYADALAAAQAHAAESGALQVHAYDQRETLLGQGSLALELSEQDADVDTILVPVGGGGLIGGVAACYAGSARVVGVEPVEAPTLTAARAAGHPVDAPAGGIAADALAPRRVGELTFPITQSYVDDVVLVDDDAIANARATLWEQLRVVAEPAASVGVAALLTGAYRPDAGERLAVIVSGSNRPPGELDGAG
ncbi:MAG: pyridoxal-phosphate dependent enzyme [Pseudonocardiaceae bacterium]|nr:pyridoxal-phosphate dependent enzyme [Pseudonocardiaceae bacterium]